MLKLFDFTILKNVTQVPNFIYFRGRVYYGIIVEIETMTDTCV